MAVNFPYSVPFFADVLRMSSVRARLVADQQISGQASGRIIVADMAPKHWEFEVTLINMENALAKRVQAMIEALDESMNDFYLYDPRSAYPAYDPTGAILAGGTSLALGGEASFGNVATGVYRVEGSAVSIGYAMSVVSDAGTYFDASGILQTAPANTIRVDFGPFANFVRNPKGAGLVAGSPGTMPTYMGSNNGGLTRTVVGSGTIGGIEYFDIRLAGTTSNTFALIEFENTAAVAASVGQVWSQAVFCAIVGGSLANITNVQTVLREVGAAGSATANMTLTSTLTRQPTATRTMGSGVTNAWPTLTLLFASGVAVDITLRIGFPTLERAAVASAYPRSPVALLADPAASNKLARSREFDNAAWTKIRSTVVANVAGVVDPWGTALADKLIEDSTAANSHFMHQVYTTTNYVNHVGYFIARAAERTKVKIELSNFSTPTASAVFDLAAGTVSAASSGTGDFTGASATMFALGNGWYWCEIEALKTAGDNDCYLTIGLCDAAGATNYNGDGVSGIYLAYAQLDEGTVGRMPIVTTTAAVNRAADQLTFKAKGLNDFTLTFDDNSTQTVVNASANWAPASSSFNRSRIKGWSAIRKSQPVAEAVQIASLAGNNKEMGLKKLPAGFRLSGGEFLAFDFGSPSHRAYHRIVSDAVASGDGLIDAIEVRPHIQPGAAIDAEVTLIKPAARVKMIPGSFDPGTGKGIMTTGMSFKARQVV